MNQKPNKQSSYEYWLRNKEACAARRKKWREANPDYWRKRRAKDPEKHKIYGIQDQGRRRSRVGKASQATLEYIRVLKRDPCVYCGGLMQHIDHVVPIINKGEHSWENLAAACSKCNLGKGKRSLLDFLREEE